MAFLPPFLLTEDQRRLQNPLDRSSLTDQQAGVLRLFLKTWRTFTSGKRKRKIIREYPPAKWEIINGTSPNNIQRVAGSSHFGLLEAAIAFQVCYTLGEAPTAEDALLATPIKPNPFTRVHHGEIREVIASKLSPQWLDDYIEPALQVERSLKCYCYSEMNDTIDMALAKHKDGLIDGVLRLNQAQEREETVTGPRISDEVEV